MQVIVTSEEKKPISVIFINTLFKDSEHNLILRMQ